MILTYDYTTPKYKDDTIKCPKCGRKAVISSFSPPTPVGRDIYVHVQSHDTVVNAWRITDYCSAEVPKA